MKIKGFSAVSSHRTKKKCLFSPRKNFFVKSRLITSKKLRLYSNTERKRQYTGKIYDTSLDSIQGNYRIYKEYTNPKDP